MKRKMSAKLTCFITVLFLFFSGIEAIAVTSDNYEALPPFISSGAPPLVMLVMGRNHKLYYEAYNDASDLNEDDVLDIRYSPATINYYGYFDSFKCYTYASSLFSPSSQTTDKTCSGASEWSGDFLNYATMTRMDTMRKVLYGGYRSTDTATDTILERIFVPQDGHSWGKEYTSIAVDGYDIADYTPFTAPVDGSGLRHLFASTTVDADGDGDGSDDLPLLRVALNNTHRIWEWVAKEGPVADDSIETAAVGHPGHPGDTTDPPDDASAHAEFEALVSTYANAANLQSPSLVPAGTTNIDGGGDYGDNYLAIFTGTLNVQTAGTYSIAVDGDDAVEVIIDGGTANEEVIGYYGAHGPCGCTTHSRDIFLSAGAHTIEYRMEEAGGGDEWYLYWDGSIIPASNTNGISNLTFNTYSLSSPASSITDYVTRVKVCDSSVGLESNCKQYPDGNYKPIGLLQRHGENDRMYFGLLTGSYENNMSGGVLRKQVGSIKNEILTTTNGRFDTSVNGIVQTINKMRIYDWSYSGHGNYNGCGLITNGPMSEGQCKDWGNPVAEMMYETQRYFAGKGAATSDFDYSGTTADSNLGLPKASWNDPYDLSDNGFESCSKPFMLVLSDINPTYDSDQLPGVASEFGSGITGDLTGLDVETLGNTISTSEASTGDTFIGQNAATDDDGACTAKDIGGFGDIRGLCPEEPTKRGSYYSASVAYYGHENDLNTASGDQKVTTYSVGLASPLPRIEIPINGQTITLVPFGKSVGGCTNAGFSAAEGSFQPSNTIVDFFVEEITPTSGTFRINYEDVEQGNDHDMDAIVRYEYQVDDNGTVDTADDTVDISLDSTYAAGCIIQHMGYVISGTTADGPYLEVRDEDTGTGTSDPDYFLDTPPGELPGGDWDDDTHLPLTTTRTFTPSNNPAAQLLKNPLWYAAKWGAFTDEDGDNTPSYADADGNVSDQEWDKDGDGIPDTYYYVTNPLRLEQQLNRSFASILNQASSGTAASVISNTRSGEGAIYQSVFFPSKTDAEGHTVSWVGQVHGFLMDAYGNMREDTNGNGQLDLIEDYIIVFNEDGTANLYEDTNGDQRLELSGGDTAKGSAVELDELNYLWVTSDWLNDTDLDSNIAVQRTITGNSYLTDDDKRYIFTWVDADSDGAVDSGETKDFVWPSTAPAVTALDDGDKIYPYLTLYPSFLDTPVAISDLSAADLDAFLVAQTGRQINFIRGKDYLDDSGAPEPLDVGSGDIAGTELRSRRYDGETWRLGDITYSTPTLVGRPAENYHLLYNDTSYAPFAAKYKNRRQVIYAGANDGMVHAFNGGFYDTVTKKFCIDSPCGDDATMPALGSELWAYVPFNLLPHLYWLTQTSYDETKHVYYVDQKPRVFDAKIFTEETECSDLSDADCVHPGGWGTVMVIGMRFGGGSIVADMDKRDGATTPSVSDPLMKSAFMVFDITNPETAPVLLAELTMPKMGFSTSYPTVVVMRDGDHDGTYGDYDSDGENRWFLAFGSGPADSNGDPGHFDTATGVYDDTALDNAISAQPGQFYMLDLVKLASSNEIHSLNNSGVLTAGLHSYAALDADTFISDPVTVDFDLDYNADVLYFGTVSDDSGDWSGKLRRIIVDDQNDANDDMDPANWVADSVLLDAGQPISAAPTIAKDDDGRNWVFFGTGRFFTSGDKVDVSQQSYYGLKEPIDSITLERDWSAASDLLNVTDFEIYTDRSIVASSVAADAYDPGGTTKTFDDLTATMLSKGGWYLDFATGERNLGQAALLGGLLSFTTFTPTSDICSAGGSSDLWALYYKTGTAHYTGVLGSTTVDVDGEDKEKAETKIDLGAGLATSPNIHVGRGDGSTVFVQSSTGEITRIEEENPMATKSGMQSWQLE